jgi:hypothetical protein
MAVTARRQRPDRRRGRGAVLVEAAFVLPVVLLTVFGVIEAGLFFATSSTTNNAARDGARYGAANFATSADRTVAADLIRDEVVDSLGGLTSYGTPLTLWIYEADPATGNPADPSGCTIRCFRYTWQGGTFTDRQGNWGTSGAPGGVNEVDACVGGTAGGGNRAVGGVDSIGVQVQVSYETVSGVIGSRTISQHTVMRIEPLPNVQCTSGI